MRAAAAKNKLDLESRNAQDTEITPTGALDTIRLMLALITLRKRHR